MFESYEDVAMEDYEDFEDLEDLGELDPEEFEDLESLEALDELADPEEYEDFEDLEDWEDMGEEEWAPPRGRGRVTVLPPITIRVRPVLTLHHFRFNSTAVRRRHLPKIKRLASLIAARARRTRGRVTVRLVGHTDRVGSAGFNRTLGKRRAIAVAARLRRELGMISPTLNRRVHIIPQTAGEARPAMPGNTPQARSFNRRVQAYIQ